MTHDPARHAQVRVHLLGSGVDVLVQRQEFRPWRCRLRDIADRAAIQQEVANVGVSNFFWSYSTPGPLPTKIPPCLPTMSLTIFFCRATCGLPPS